MDKKTFYAELVSKLSALEVSQGYIEAHIIVFEKMFSELSEDDIAQIIEKLGDLDILAQRIKATEENEQKEASIEVSNEPVDPLVDEPTPFESDGANHAEDDVILLPADDVLAEFEEIPLVDEEDILNMSADFLSEPGVLSSAREPELLTYEEVADAGEAQAFVPAQPHSADLAVDDPEIASDAPNGDSVDVTQPSMEFEGDNVISFTPVSRDHVYSDDASVSDNPEKMTEVQEKASPAKRDKRRKKKQKEKPSEMLSAWEDDIADVNAGRARSLGKFWLFFLISFPIALAAMISTVVVFTVLFFLIAVLIILFVAALVAITAVGTLVSVFGLIFGVAQMLTSPPIGIYECGLAIMFGSAAMFVGILIYNIAVRLLPFIAKCLLRLFKLIFRQIKRFYVFFERRYIG